MDDVLTDSDMGQQPDAYLVSSASQPTSMPDNTSTTNDGAKVLNFADDDDDEDFLLSSQFVQNYARK